MDYEQCASEWRIHTDQSVLLCCNNSRRRRRRRSIAVVVGERKKFTGYNSRAKKFAGIITYSAKYKISARPSIVYIFNWIRSKCLNTRENCAALQRSEIVVIQWKFRSASNHHDRNKSVKLHLYRVSANFNWVGNWWISSSFTGNLHLPTIYI